MKFGKKLRFRAVYPWLAHYIDYKGLKKVVKQAKLSGKPIAKEFDAMFDAQLKKVCSFYNAVFLRLQTEIKAVTERSVDYIASSLCTMDGMTALETLLHHLSCELSKLVDFAEVNVEGFRKIAKKFHKHVPESGMRFMPRVRAQPMAHQHDVQGIANLLESGLGELSRVKRTVKAAAQQSDDAASTLHTVKHRLHRVLRTGNTKHLEYLLQSSSITPLVLAVNGPALLHLAAAKNNVPCVAILIDAGVDQDSLDVVGDTPVCTAAKHGSVAALKFLLKNGGSVESDTYLLTNPLHYAVKAQSIECVRVLLDHARSRGAKALYKMVAHLDRESFSAAYHACLRNSAAILKVLLGVAQEAVAGCAELDADSARSAGSGVQGCECSATFPAGFLGRRGGGDAAVWTCLNSAAYAGACDCLALLLEFLCSTCVGERCAASSSTALHSAARSGHTVSCTHLVDAGSPVAALNAYSETPMHLACLAAQPDCLAVMLPKAPREVLAARIPLSLYEANAPASIPMRSVDVYVPLLMQAVDSESPACVKLLLEAGCDPLEETVDGWSALALALFGGMQSRNDIPDMLEEAGARRAAASSPPPLHTPPVIATPPRDQVSTGAGAGASAAAATGTAAGAGAGAGAAAASAQVAPPPAFEPTTGDHANRGTSPAGDDSSSASVFDSMTAFAQPDRVTVRKRTARKSPCQRGLWELQIRLGTVSSDPKEFSRRNPAVGLTSFPRSDRLIRNRITVTVVQSKSKEETGHASRSETSKAGTIGLERFLDVSADDAVVQARARRQHSLPPSAPTAARSLSSGLPVPPDDAALGVGASAGSLDGSSEGTTGSGGAAVGADPVPEGGRSLQGVDGCAEHRVTLTLYKAWSAKSPYAWETLPPGVSHDADQLLSFSGLGPSECCLRFDVTPSVGAMLGRVYVRWDHLRRCADFQSSREMEGQCSMALMGPGLTHVGSINFRFLFILPYSAPTTVPRPAFSWKTTAVWGHRGLGADNSAYGIGPVGARKRRTHVAENTLLAFITAASLGASYIEFDVHLSRDHVPVIHHNYTVKLGNGITVPLGHLTAAQLAGITPDWDTSAPSPSRGAGSGSGSGSGSGRVAGKGGKALKRAASSGGKHGVRPHSRSDVTSDLAAAPASVDARKMLALGLDPARHSRLAQQSGRLADSYISLETAFERVPASTGFNIEVKYPNNIKEKQDSLRVPPRNMLVDKVLDVVFRCGKGRHLLFSSFDPAICTLLAAKQVSYPVFFLTTAGQQLYADPRKNSLRQAIHFAKSAGLFGIVSEASVLIRCPRLITEVRAAGLMLCTYGAVNNQAEAVRIQKRFGVAAVIVDHVTHIAKSLRDSSAASTDSASVGGGSVGSRATTPVDA